MLRKNQREVDPKNLKNLENATFYDRTRTESFSRSSGENKF